MCSDGTMSFRSQGSITLHVSVHDSGTYHQPEEADDIEERSPGIGGSMWGSMPTLHNVEIAVGRQTHR